MTKLKQLSTEVEMYDKAEVDTALDLKQNLSLTNLTSTNLNTIITNWKYCSQSSCTNLPEAWVKTKLIVNVDPSNTNLVMQEAIPTTTLISYIRTSANWWSSWTSWTRIKATDETKEPLKWSDDNYVTDAEKTKLSNLSWTNTWDNAVNSLYSWLATSKQDTLVSWTNIKTINWTSILWGWDIVISWGGWWAQMYEWNIDWQTFVWMIARFTVKTTQTIDWVKISWSSLPTWSNFTLDIRKNGTATANSIFFNWLWLSIITTQTAENGIYTTTSTDLVDNYLIENDILYIIITSNGSTLPLKDLYFLIY